MVPLFMLYDLGEYEKSRNCLLQKIFSGNQVKSSFITRSTRKVPVSVICGRGHRVSNSVFKWEKIREIITRQASGQMQAIFSFYLSLDSEGHLDYLEKVKTNTRIITIILTLGKRSETIYFQSYSKETHNCACSHQEPYV